MKKSLMILLILALLGGTALAAGHFEATISPVEWSWLPGKVSTFEGTVSLPETRPESLKLKLEIATDLDQQDQGAIVFTYFNERRLTVRKQAAEMTVQTEGLGDTVSFRGSWTLPEEIYVSSADISFSIADDQAELFRSTSHFSEDNAIGQSGSRRILRVPFNIDQIIRWTLIAGGVIWCAAILRMLISRARKKPNPKGA